MAVTVDEFLYKLGFENEREFVQTLDRIYTKGEREAEKEGKQAGKKYQKGFALAAGVIGGVVGSAVTLAFNEAQIAIANFSAEVQLRSREIEAENIKISQVFGKSEGSIRSWSDSVRKQMGLSAQEVTSLAANTQDLLIPMGFQREEAGKLTKETLNLSAALSQWDSQQRSSQEISEILTKAYLGEREQLKSLGISISEADVKGRLLAKGQAKLTGEALQQAKALATLELITEKSSDAQIAFANNTDTAARAQAEMRSTIKESRDELAQTLIPVMNDFNANVAPVFVQAQANIISAFNDLVTSIFRVESQFQQSINGILNQVNQANRAGVKALSDEIERQTELAEKYQKQIEVLTPSAERNLAIIDAGARAKLSEAKNRLEATQSNLEFLNGELKQILKQEGVILNGPSASPALSPVPTFTAPTSASAPSSSSSGSPSLSTPERSIEDVFKDLETLGIEAEKRAAAFGNSLEARAESVQTRISLVSKALDELITMGGSEAETRFLAGRIEQLEQEQLAIENLQTAFEDAEKAKEAAWEQELANQKERNSIHAALEQEQLDMLKSIEAEKEALAKKESETRAFLANLRSSQRQEEMRFDAALAELRADSVNTRLENGKRAAEAEAQLERERAAFKEDLFSRQRQSEMAFQEALSEIAAEGARTRLANAEAYAEKQRRLEEEAKARALANQQEINDVRASYEAAGYAMLLDVITNGNVKIIEAQRVFGEASREDVIEALEQQIAYIERLAANADPASEFYLTLANAIQQARQELEQLNKEGSVTIPVPDAKAEVSDEYKEAEKARETLEGEIEDVILDFPMSLYEGIKSGDIGGAMLGSLENAADFFIGKMVEGILGDVAKNLAKTAASNLLGGATGAGAAGAAALGPLGLFLGGAAAIFGIASLLKPQKSTRVRDFDTGGEVTSGSSRGAASINQTAAVTINVEQGLDIGSVSGRSELKALAVETVREQLRILGLLPDGNL